ncbi:MAG: hypothetical protein ACFFKA_09725, partial [Candidatus Thorarchaeota archaeon]
QGQQNLVDQWSFFLNTLESQNPTFRYYEVPTLSYGYKFMRFMIDGGMRAGIPDRNIRARTITVYLNKNEFKKALNIKSEDTIHLFLINKQGDILWRSEGNFDQNKIEGLKEILLNFKAQKGSID